jgi:hypothetical protein
MKREHSYEENSKSKKPSLGSIHGPGPATSTSDLIPSIPATTSDATASAQVTAGVTSSVSVQRSALPIASLSINFVIEQTAHIPAVSTSVPALEMSGLPTVRVPGPPHLI